MSLSTTDVLAKSVEIVTIAELRASTKPYDKPNTMRVLFFVSSEKLV